VQVRQVEWQLRHKVELTKVEVGQVRLQELLNRKRVGRQDRQCCCRGPQQVRQLLWHG
jgi:hypothetical protein